MAEASATRRSRRHERPNPASPSATIRTASSSTAPDVAPAVGGRIRSARSMASSEPTSAGRADAAGARTVSSRSIRGAGVRGAVGPGGRHGHRERHGREDPQPRKQHDVTIALGPARSQRGRHGRTRRPTASVQSAFARRLRLAPSSPRVDRSPRDRVSCNRVAMRLFARPAGRTPRARRSRRRDPGDPRPRRRDAGPLQRGVPARPSGGAALGAHRAWRPGPSPSRTPSQSRHLRRRPPSLPAQTARRSRPAHHPRPPDPRRALIGPGREPRAPATWPALSPCEWRSQHACASAGVPRARSGDRAVPGLGG